MKRLMTCALGLSLMLGVASLPAEAAGKKVSKSKHAKHVKRARRAKISNNKARH